MREKVVKLTLINGEAVYAAPEVFNTFGVAESPTSVISSHIRGSSGPLLKVFLEETLTGVAFHINANFILKVEVTY